MIKIFSTFLNLQSILIRLIQLKEKFSSLGKETSIGLIFSSSLTSWKWQHGFIEISFLDVLWVTTALCMLTAMIVFAARNADKKTLWVGGGAVVIALTAIGMGFLLLGNFLNCFVQGVGWFGPTLIRFFIE